MAREQVGRDCARFRSLVDEYLDGELDRSERSALDAHLHECPSCQGRLRHARGARSVLYACRRIALPEGFRSALRDRLAEEKRAQDRRARRVGFFAPALAPAAMLVLALFVAFPPGQAPAPHAPHAVQAPALRAPVVNVASIVSGPSPALAEREELADAPASRAVSPTLARPTKRTSRVAPAAGPARMPSPTRPAVSRGEVAAPRLDRIVEPADAPSFRATAPVVALAALHADGHDGVAGVRAASVAAGVAPTLVSAVPAPGGVFAPGAATRFAL